MRLDDVMGRIGERVLEQDDLLRTMWVTRRNGDALGSLFDRLADVCLEQLFLDLEFRSIVGELTETQFRYEMARLVTQCRTVGIEPPVSVDGL